MENRQMRVAFITFEKFNNRLPGSAGSSVIRAEWVYNNWKDAEEYKLARKYDVMVFQKAYWSQMIQEFEGIKIFDLCDADWIENSEAFQFYGACDAITTSTEPLAEYLRKLLPNKIIRCIPDRVDLSVVGEPRKEQSEQLKKIVWHGYAHNFHYIKGALPALLERGMEFTVYSDADIRLPDEFKAIKFEWKKHLNLNDMFAEFKKYDASLQPVGRENVDIRGKYKSNNKVIQSQAAGIPVIQHPEDLDKFKTKEAREKEVARALKEINKEYKVEKSVQEYINLIEEVKNEKSKL